jgi:hypothetical protein
MNYIIFFFNYFILFQAISGDDNDRIDLLDEKGCPTDPVIFPGENQIFSSIYEIFLSQQREWKRTT